MPTPWNDDPAGSEGQIVDNARRLLGDIARDADDRAAPAITTAQEWHRRIYEGVALPVAYYAGGIRDSDSDQPELYGYEVAVGPFTGVASQDVPDELEAFERNAQQAVAGLDSAIAVGDRPSQSSELHGVLTLCAVLHGEWVRIHPFANGNGRTARVWANWAALRYGLPPFVSIKPRPPGNPYAVAAVAGMRGRFDVAIAAFEDLLRQHLQDLA